MVKTIGIRYICGCDRRQTFKATRDLSKAYTPEDSVTVECPSCFITYVGKPSEVYEKLRSKYSAQMYGRIGADHYEFSSADIISAKYGHKFSKLKELIDHVYESVDNEAQMRQNLTNLNKLSVELIEILENKSSE